MALKNIGLWVEEHDGSVVAGDVLVFCVPIEKTLEFSKFLAENFQYNHLETIPCELQGNFLVFTEDVLSESLNLED